MGRSRSELMSEAQRSLEERLRARISEGGPISYEELIDVVLYDEEQGYYRRGKQEGVDYYTSPEVHPAFGRTIGRYLERVAELVRTDRFSILELGGGTGRLARDIISSIDTHRLTRYLILEKGRRISDDGVEWIETPGQLPALNGLTFVIANEFFDALAFHKIIMKDGNIREIYVGCNHGFFEVPGPLTADAASFLRLLPLDLDEGQVCEVTTKTPAIIRDITKALDQSVFLIFDYGYHGDDLAWGRFANGSAVGYRDMVMRADILTSMGGMDITHHVNFDHLSALLQGQGWKKVAEVPQYRFLFLAGIIDALEGLGQEERLRAKMLIDPHGLGSTLNVLAFTKDVAIELPGFKKSRTAP